ncbi:hypothetical protein Tco_1245741 [Tanacetum coccineum]
MDKKDSGLDEILEDLFRIGAKNLRQIGEEKIQNECDDDTSMGTNNVYDNLLNFPIFSATHEFSSVCEQDVDLEKKEPQVEDGDDGDTYDIWDITVEDVEQIRKFLTPNVPDRRYEILNVTMVNEEADFNPTKDIEKLERLLAKDPQSHFIEIQVLNSKDFVMSDSEHSMVTYTEVSSAFEDLSDVGSPGFIVLGYDGLPVMSEDPYAYVEAAVQEPPPPDFVPELVYPEFMPPEDDVLPAEEQPLPAAVSPTADSQGYITESDPKEDPDEDDEEDPTDYPTDRDDDEEEEKESSEDDANNEEEDEGEDEEEEEEHLAPADSVPPPAYQVDIHLAISTLPPSPLTSYSSPLPHIPSPPLPVSSPLPISPSSLPASPTHSLGYRAVMIRLRAESPSTSHPLPLPLPQPIVLLCTRASIAMMRATTPSTYCLAPPSWTPPSGTPPILPIPLPTSLPPLLLPFTDCRVDVPEVTLPPRKRLCISPGPRFEVRECSFAPTARPTGGFRADYGFVGTLDAEIRRDPDREIGYGITDIWKDPDEIAEEIPTTDVEELGQRMTDFVTTVRQDTDEIYGRLDNAQDDRLLMSGQLNFLRRDRRAHDCTARLMKSEARASCDAWVQSIDASDTTCSEVRALRTTVLAQ